METIFILFGLVMFAWYLSIRWTLLGNELGKYITQMIDGKEVTIFKLNWWFAPVNIMTAFCSIVFLTVALFDYEKSFNYEWIYYIAIMLLGRNIWYTFIDIIDYISEPTSQQLMYIIIDIMMAMCAGYWISIYKSVN
jgi:hypothetical protein